MEKFFLAYYGVGFVKCFIVEVFAMKSGKYGSSSICFSLPVRVVLTLLLGVPALMFLLEALYTVVSDWGSLAATLYCALLVVLTPVGVLVGSRVLVSIWTYNPRWRDDQREAAALERRLQWELQRDRYSKYR